jgi:hypothetical protein
MGTQLLGMGTQLLGFQYMYFCTSKASKVSACVAAVVGMAAGKEARGRKSGIFASSIAVLTTWFRV